MDGDDEMTTARFGAPLSWVGGRACQAPSQAACQRTRSSRPCRTSPASPGARRGCPGPAACGSAHGHDLPGQAAAVLAPAALAFSAAFGQLLPQPVDLGLMIGAVHRRRDRLVERKRRSAVEGQQRRVLDLEADREHASLVLRRPATRITSRWRPNAAPWSTEQAFRSARAAHPTGRHRCPSPRESPSARALRGRRRSSAAPGRCSASGPRLRVRR